MGPRKLAGPPLPSEGSQALPTRLELTKELRDLGGINGTRTKHALRVVGHAPSMPGRADRREMGSPDAYVFNVKGRSYLLRDLDQEIKA